MHFRTHCFFAPLALSTGFVVPLLAFALGCSSNADAPAGPTSAGGNPAAGGSDAGNTGGAPAGGGGTDGKPGSGGETGGTAAADPGAGGVSSGGETAAGGAPNVGGESSTGGQGDASGGNHGGDVVTRTASTFEFRHFPIEASDTGVWDGAMDPGTQVTTTTFDTVVLENTYLKVTLLPAYGGRILSIVHKPTNQELLYQNPLGTPYLMYEDIFYYDYLVILGGIFSSFPEPEHGKYWNQPYELTVIGESPEAVTVRMSRKDDLDLVDGVATPYDVGRTDVLVELDVTLRAGRSSLELATKLTNTRESAVPRFEYWTVTTLAPGSTPGDTKIPLETRILAQMDQVHLLESSWDWFGTAEERVNGEVFIWDNLSYFENWVDQGTAFANPLYDAGWSGLFNYENQTGTLRVSPNLETPGLKLWTFGTPSLDIDITDSSEWLRPTIEMWHGITPEFWDRGSMAAGEVRTWTDHYYLTQGLTEVTAASEYGAVQLSTLESGADEVLSAVATLTIPHQAVRAILRLDGAVVAEHDGVVDPENPLTLSAVVSGGAPPGAVFQAEFLRGDESLLAGQLTLP